MDPRNIYIHVGYGKAGSTTLQKNLFANHPELRFFNFYEYLEGVPEEDPVRHFYLSTPYMTELDYRELAQKIDLKKALYREIGDDPRKTVFSSEAFVTSGYTDNYLKALRLKELFPEGKVVMIVRNQLDVVRSLFDRWPQHPICVRLTSRLYRFDEWMEATFDDLQRSMLPSYRYDEHVALYRELFGEENLLVLPMEMLKNDPEGYSRAIARFMEIDEGRCRELLTRPAQNQAATVRFDRYRRFRQLLPAIRFRRFLPAGLYDRAMALLKSGKRHKTEISPRWQQALEAYYGESNRKLQERMPGLIDGLGYPGTGPRRS